jgi:sialate O-acetylesterase
MPTQQLLARATSGSEAGEQITIHFRNANATSSANALGRWELYLPPGDAAGPFTMEIQGANRIVLSDILVGDLWIASGQSNMEFTAHEVIHADEALKNASSRRFACST